MYLELFNQDAMCIVDELKSKNVTVNHIITDPPITFLRKIIFIL